MATVVLALGSRAQRLRIPPGERTLSPVLGRRRRAVGAAIDRTLMAEAAATDRSSSEVATVVV